MVTAPRIVKTRIYQTNGEPLKQAYCWILNHSDFQQWRDDKDSRVRWIKGDPGKGKTQSYCLPYLHVLANPCYLLGSIHKHTLLFGKWLAEMLHKSGGTYTSSLSSATYANFLQNQLLTLVDILLNFTLNCISYLGLF